MNVPSGKGDHFMLCKLFCSNLNDLDQRPTTSKMEIDVSSRSEWELHIFVLEPRMNFPLHINPTSTGRILLVSLSVSTQLSITSIY